jgi:hypothetical protein
MWSSEINDQGLSVTFERCAIGVASCRSIRVDPRIYNNRGTNDEGLF